MAPGDRPVPRRVQAKRARRSSPRRSGPGEARTRRLVARAKRGDPHAKELVVEQHMRLVSAIAHRYCDLGLPEEDLKQEGVIGLLEAIDRFDLSNGASFSTYAHWRVRQAITHALTERGRLLRLPKDILERRRLIARSMPILTNGTGAPMTREIADRTGLSPEQVLEALHAPTSVASLDAPLADGRTLEAALPDPTPPDPFSAAAKRTEERLVDKAVAHLPRRERAIIEAHYGLGRDSETLAELAEDLGVSETRVRALEQRALFDLAKELEPQLIEWAPEGSTT